MANIPSSIDQFDRVEWQEPEKVPTGWMAQGTLFSGDLSWPVSAWRDRIGGKVGSIIRSQGNYRTAQKASAAREYVMASFKCLMAEKHPDIDIRLPKRLKRNPRPVKIKMTEPYRNAKGFWEAKFDITTDANKDWKAVVFKYHGLYGNMRVSITENGKPINQHREGEPVAHAIKQELLKALRERRAGASDPRHLN
jgi:hypothetical protein